MPEIAFTAAKSFRSAALIILCMSAATASAKEFAIPELRDPVTDQAGVLDARYVETLNHALWELKEKTGTQLAVLTLPDLAGLPIEQASIKIVEKWKLGSAKGDEGVLFLIAVKERALRIEVGQGLEGKLTDADSKRIISDSVVPLFKAGEMSQGILVGVYQIAQKTNPEFDMGALLEGGAQGHRQSQGRRGGAPGILFLLLIIVVALINRLSRFAGSGRGFRRSYSGWGGGGWGGGVGGWGGSGGGGGGFGGGGGGFSGGGASGNW